MIRVWFTSHGVGHYVRQGKLSRNEWHKSWRWMGDMPPAATDTAGIELSHVDPSVWIIQ